MADAREQGGGLVPSGYTHCILARLFNEKSGHGNSGLRFLLRDKMKYFQLGALGPDLPYSQVPRIWNEQEKIADKLHYHQTTELPRRVFEKIRSIPDSNEKDEAFCFFLGFVSHVVADGIIHPFVRDKVGDYEQNKTAHRTLEMRLDVILMDEMTKNSGSATSLNFTNFHHQLKDPVSRPFSHIADLMAETINQVYEEKITGRTVEDWVDDMHDLFAVAEGENNQYYAGFPGMKDVLFPSLEQVMARKGEDLILKRFEAKGRPENFLGRDIHFITDCIPMFYRAFTPIALRLFNFTFSDGPALTEADFPAINLDTGRGLAIADGKDLDQPLPYWSLA